MLFDKSKFATKKEMFAFIVQNKAELIAQKKSIIKHADGFEFSGAANIIYNKKVAYKTNEPIENPANDLNVLAVINTTNWLDGHDDVHIPGLWTKSLQENKSIMHVQEHKSNEFSKIISSGSDLKVSAIDTTWKELGYDIEGTTQALMFDSTVRKSRNKYMHDQYAKGFVTNHSVGMRYVKLTFCCDDSDFGAEFEAWEKYFPEVANKETAEDNGYFWAVTEAKLIEGSAVPAGSNTMTPTLENGGGNENEEIQEAIEESEIKNYEPLIKALDKYPEPEKSTLYNNLVNSTIKNL